MINPMSLDGRSVIVTGAAQGIGLATAHLLYELGAQVTMLDRNNEKLGEAASAFDAGRILVQCGSITDRAFVGHAVAAHVARFGAVDSLVNNAGITRTAMIARSEKFRDRYLSNIPLGRFLSPDEAAYSIAFLLSPASAFITGQHLSVNGGGHITA